jgi:hypothetical protein
VDDIDRSQVRRPDPRRPAHEIDDEHGHCQKKAGDGAVGRAATAPPEGRAKDEHGSEENPAAVCEERARRLGGRAGFDATRPGRSGNDPERQQREARPEQKVLGAIRASAPEAGRTGWRRAREAPFLDG